MWLTGVVAGFLIVLLEYKTDASSSPWNWNCENGQCVKKRKDPHTAGLSLEACKMFCNEFGLFWPSPTGIADRGTFLSKLNVEKIAFHIEKSGTADDLMKAAGRRFRNLIKMNIPDGTTPLATGKSLDIYLVNAQPNVQEFSLTMDESYTLNVHAKSNDNLNATITAGTFFGIRHGLETLSQVIFYDELKDHLLIVRDVVVADKPAYPYRGILLDTSRSYISVPAIKSTIDAMAAVKLNTFHWHITDTHSFPFVSERQPKLSILGAYSPKKVYTKKAIQEIVQFGLERGVRVLPEFDAPAHVGAGWEDTDLVVCHNAFPWHKYCVEPPCGQLNPSKEGVYSYLEDIYKDMAVSFTTTDLFHMGGDEVNEKCWNSSEQIVDFAAKNNLNVEREGKPATFFFNIWNYFQKRAQEKAYLAFGKRIPIILWTSTLTQYQHIEKYLDKEDYIIQIWTTSIDPQIKGLLEKGYRIIMSNYDALYFDCGFGAWIGPGNNWCSPYVGWQKVYDNDMQELIVGAEDYKDQILGAEATLWSEQADSASVDGRLWPRAAALAERLWSNPETGHQQAMQRILHIRERLVRMGIQAEVLQPEYCYQNEGICE